MKFRKIDLPFTITPSTPFLELHLNENGPCWVEFVARYTKNNKYARVRITFERCIAGKLLGMGGESADSKFPIGQILDSNWLKEFNDLELKYYPNHRDNFKQMNHYFIQAHDANAEIIAEGYSWETIKELKNF